MPDPKLALLSCLSLSLSAFEEQHPFSGQVWSCLLNQGLFLPWVHGTDVAVWIKSASFRIWLLWQIRGGDSTSPTEGQDGKTCLGRDSSPCSLGWSRCVCGDNAISQSRAPQVRVRGGKCQLCPLLTCPMALVPPAPSWASAAQEWGVQLQQSSTARAGDAPATEDTASNTCGCCSETNT